MIEIGLVLAIKRGRQHSGLVDDLVAEAAAARSKGVSGPTELATDVLMQALQQLWEVGWQPLDSIHAVRRQAPRLEPLALAAVSEEARRSSAALRAPDGWLDQLDELFQLDEDVEAIAPAPEPEVGLFEIEVEDQEGPEPLTTKPWSAIDMQSEAGRTLRDAWLDVLRLIGILCYQPDMPKLLPPPSKWSRRHRQNGERQTTGAHNAKILGRIRNLLAKAEATPYAAEAEALTAKAQDLMTRHSIDEALLQGENEKIAIQSTRIHIVAPYASAKVQLLHHIGEANRVRVVWSKELAIATVVGTPVDVRQVEMLFTSLLVQATHAMLEEGGSQSGGHDRSSSFRKSFLLAYAVRIGERLVEADAQATAAEAKAHGRDLVPMFARQAEAVESEFDRLFPRLGKSGTYSVNPRGWDAGRRAADRAQF
ncbi:DUF2786 domain-containing protein [Antricoccus suffuscus]|nr:DUF2786 domain-containing protein [Antricoccus suffuscus]